MMKRGITRFLGLMLAVAMTAGLLPATALAASQEISGTVKASTLADNAEITLSGTTTLIVDTNKTLKSIKGDHALTISGGTAFNTLTINSGGHGIETASFAMDGVIVVIDSKRDGVNADGDITVNSGFLSIDAGKDGIYSESGSIMIHGGIVDSGCGTNCAAIQAMSGDIHVTAGKVIASGAKEGITADGGSIYLEGEVEAAAAGWAIWAKKDLKISGSTKARSGCAIQAKGSIAIKADVEAISTVEGAPAISAIQSITVNGGSVTADCSTNGAAMMSYEGNIVVNAGSVKALGAKEGITAEEGSVMIYSDVEASASGWAIWAKQGITLYGKTKARAGCAIWSGGSIAINADVEAEAFMEAAPAISAKQNITINGGTILADCTTNGAAIISHGGNITVNNADVTASGAKEGITADEGSITLAGTVTATGAWAIWAKNSIDVTGGTVKARGSAIGLTAQTGSITIAGNVTAEGQIMSGGKAIFAGQNVVFKSGPIIAIGSEKAVSAKNGTVSVQSPLAITTPAGGKVSAKTIVTSDNDVAKAVVIEARPLHGTAKIDGSVKYVGETLSFTLSDDFPVGPYLSQWQYSTDKANWHDITSGGSGTHYTTKAGDVNRYIRVRVTRSDYGGEVCSDSRWINPLPELNGTIAYTSAVNAGAAVTTQFTHTLQAIYSAIPEKIHLQWQISGDGTSGWTDISGATAKPYTPIAANVGKYIRLVATADGYTGSVISTAREVLKQKSTDDPVSPQLSKQSPYSAVTVANAKADQEYAVSYALGSPDWTNAKHPASSGALSLPCDPDRTVYVYTRMRETDTRAVGTKTVYSKIYNGYVTYLADLVFDKTSVTTKVGEVTALTVSPLPEEFSGWNSDYTVTWFVNGYGVELFSNPECSIPVTQHASRSYKTVYAKATAQTSNVEVGVEKQVGYNDVRTAFCTFKIANAAGYYLPESIHFEDVTMRPGETAEAGYTAKPAPAMISTMSFTKNQGPSDLSLNANGDGSVTITAPEDAAAGTYYYRVIVNGNDSMLTAIRIDVLSEEAVVTLDAANGSGQKRKHTVKIGSEYVLPELPDSFSIPDGFEFDGWDRGKPGEGIIIFENTTVKAAWKAHVHHIMPVAATAPTCVWDGNAAYYTCPDCGKNFEDAAGTMEAPTIDYFILPATGHTPVLVPAKAATCTVDGNIAYYECAVCGKRLADAAGTTEIVDYHEVLIDAPGHSYADGVCTRCGEKEPEYTSNPFTDVATGQYYYDPVLWAVNHSPQITNGTSPTTFSPDSTCTRAQVVTFLWRAMGQPEPTSTVNPFTDVNEDLYYYKAVLWALEKGITTGTSATAFSPNAGCTRGQVVTFLHRAQGTPTPGSSVNPFTDVKSGQYYYEAVLWAVNHSPQITNGTSATTFSPNATCTRGQIVTFLYRSMK